MALGGKVGWQRMNNGMDERMEREMEFIEGGTIS